MKVLFLTLYPGHIPSSRFRIFQYRSYLEEHHIACAMRPVLPDRLFRALFNRGDFFRRFAFHAGESLNRLKDIIAGSRYDLVVVQKGLVSTNLIGFDKLLGACNRSVVFDFDDAVFGLVCKLPDHLRLLQDEGQVRKIIRLSRTVLAGNGYLAELARPHNNSVVVLPTAVNTEVFRPVRKTGHSGRITVGWSGTASTNCYANMLIPVINRIGSKYPVKFIIISNTLKGIDRGDLDKHVEFEFIPWKDEKAVSDLGRIDIGTMPLPDDAWTRGKCAFKAILHMSMGTPVVVSPVGMNTEVVKDGENGFFARTEDEWVDRLSTLIEDEALRRRLGDAGRQTAEERYSFRVNAPRLKAILEGSAACRR